MLCLIKLINYFKHIEKEQKSVKVLENSYKTPVEDINI